MKKEQFEKRLHLLEAAVKALDARLERAEKILDNNASVHADVTAMMGAEVTILRRILEDMVRGDTVMRQVGKIDFDAYVHQYNEVVQQEMAERAKEAEESEKDTDEVFEFGGDHVQDERPRQEIA